MDFRVNVEEIAKGPEFINLKLNKLKSCLAPEIQKRVYPSVIQGTAQEYDRVFKKIKQTWGRSDMVVDALKEDLLRGDKISSVDDVEGMGNFVAEAEQVLTAIEVLRESDDLTNFNKFFTDRELKELVDRRLPKEWFRRVRRIMEDGASLTKLSTFVEEEEGQLRSTFGRMFAKKKAESAPPAKGSGRSAAKFGATTAYATSLGTNSEGQSATNNPGSATASETGIKAQKNAQLRTTSGQAAVSNAVGPGSDDEHDAGRCKHCQSRYHYIQSCRKFGELDRKTKIAKLQE